MKKTLQVWLVAGTVILAAAAMAWAGEIADPMSLGVGARPLGMGRAYVAVAENGETLFINPAGLGRLDGYKFSSMYTNLMGDVNYMVLGGVVPNVYGGSLGLGLINTGVKDINLYDTTGTPMGTASWSQNEMFLSYGHKVENDYIKNLYVGGNLKFFNMTGTSSADAGSGSGFDMDLSALYTPIPMASFGITAQNFLPSSMGAKIHRTSGLDESIPVSLKMGAKVNLFGKADEALRPSAQSLIAAVDYDFTRSMYGTAHVGLEYSPMKNLALRLGSDQSNLTAGVGLKYNGIAFDYAFHPFNSLADDTTHFFSISYVGEEKVPVLNLNVQTPEDKTVVREGQVLIKGSVEPANAFVLVNGINAQVKNGSFEAFVSLDKLGKKLVVVQATDSNGLKAEKTVRVLRLAKFTDVNQDFWAVAPIEDTSTIGLVNGYPDLTFRPENGISRAELAALLVRDKGIPLLPVKGNVYKDVKEKHWAATYIRTAKVYGLMVGYPKGDFKPNQRVTKAEVITAMVRLDKRPLLDKVQVDVYGDVKAKHWAAKYVLAARTAGMLDFVKGDKLEPKAIASRAESITILSKTNLADVQIKELHSWLVGFKREIPGQADISFLDQ